MALFASVTYLADGVATQFALTFGYQSVTEVYVTLNGVPKALNTDYFIENGVVRFKVAPASSVSVRIYRYTDITAAKVEWMAGATLSTRALTTNTRQLLYAVQELNDRLASLEGGGGDGGGTGGGENTTDTLTPTVLLERLITFLSNKTTIELP